MYHFNRENKRLCNSIKSLLPSLPLSLLLAAVFASSLFFVPKPSVAAASNDAAIVVSDDGKLVTIQGDCTTDQICSFMHEDSQDPSSGAGKDATEVHFASSLTIQTLQTGGGNAPFAIVSTLEKITSEPNITVSFEGKDGVDPTLRDFFNSCSNLTCLDGLSVWNVGNVSGDYCMDSMFRYCTNLTSLDGLSAWNVGNVSGDFCMQSMFNNCTNLTSLDGLSAWDVSNVRGDHCMDSMFQGCSDLTSLDGLSAWDAGNVSGDYCMSNMFSYCTSLTSLDGLSAWDVGNVSGDSCMQYMFGNCTSLTSLDGLSGWNVGNVSDYGCMETMFAYCSNLTSLDAIASWNIDAAIRSTGGVNSMFSGCTKIASITLGETSGFQLNSSMGLPSANWWSVKAQSAVTSDTAQSVNLYTVSKQIDTYGTRWQRCEGTTSSSPMKTVTDLQVNWPQTNADKEELIYNGLFQTLGTKDNKVQVTATIDGQTDPVTLTEGADFYVVYKDADGTDTTAIKDAGDYSARIVLRGVYVGSDSDAVEVTMKQLDLASDAYSLAAYTLPSRFPYTGSAYTPKTMVRLYLRDDPNPKDPTKLIPIYAYLVENTDKRPEGDYSVNYLSDEEVGTATAKVEPATPEGLQSSNLKNSVNAYFAIGDVFVSFDSCGGSSVPEQGTTNGGKIKVPIEPTKQGFVFDGWYKEDTYTTKWDFTTDTVSSDITLYAKWANAVTVTFNSNGGSAVDAQTVAEGATAKEPDSPTREGYSFLYWCTDEALTDEFDFSTPITADITLYAKWEEAPGPTPPGPDPTPTDTVTLTFRTDEGSWNGITETTLTGAPDAVIIPPSYPYTDATRTCIGWFDEQGNQIISGVTTFGEVTGIVTARFVDTPGWHQNNTGWWYIYDLNNNYYTNCWALINSAWFYFNDAGYCLEYTWSYINGEWYFFGWGGYMQTGWQWLGGSWYFLDRNTGAMKCGWVHDGVWYYCDAALGGAMYDNCWAYINGNWYGFNEGGSMTQGWSWSYAYDGWFYLQPDTGHMLYGWQYIGGHWYYFYNNGLMAANTYVGTYWLGADGAMW